MTFFRQVNPKVIEHKREAEKKNQVGSLRTQLQQTLQQYQIRDCKIFTPLAAREKKIHV